MHSKTCAWRDAQIASMFETSVSLLPRLRIDVQPHACGGWAIFTDGGIRTRETKAGWGATARSLFGVCHVMFGPVITAEFMWPLLGQASTPATQTKSKVAPMCAWDLGSHGLGPLGGDNPTTAVVSSTTHTSHIVSHPWLWS